VEELSEKEQLDVMRAWWSENGRYIIGGVVLGVAMLVGWNQWRGGIATAQVTASALYEDVMSATGNGNLDAAGAAATDLFDNHASTTYAAQSRLAMARLYMDNGRDKDAADVLRVLVESGKDSEMQLVGRLRLAKVLLYQNKADEVIALLQEQGDHAFAARYSELLGDAYAALGSTAEAQAAYNAALIDDPAIRTVDTSLIQLKLNDLPDPDQVAAGTATEADAGTDATVEIDAPLATEETQADEPEVESGDEAAQ